MSVLHMPVIASSVNILVVDDVRENLIALKALLKREDVEVYSAESGVEALALMLEVEFAVAIIDVQMPEMTGFELAEYMRSTVRTKRIPIIFVTAAREEAAQTFRGYESGAIDFLYKPLDNHIVRSKVNLFIDIYRQRCDLNEKIAALENTQNEQQLLLEKLHSAESRLKQEIKLRDDLISTLSHELRTPLNTLTLEYYIRRNALERKCLDEFTPEKIERMIDTDERQLKRLLHLINDLLDVSRVRGGSLSVRPVEVDLVGLVTKIVEQLTPQISMARCRVILNAQESVVGHWDEFRIEQVIINLLLNAFQFGAETTIDIDIEKTPLGVRVAVKDCGCGIAPDDQARVFNQFERGLDRKGRGLGLGLFIADQIAQAHGGRIYVCSEPGQGAIFSLLLPLRKASRAIATY